jgi:hypothetical protein
MASKHTPGEWSMATRIASTHKTYVIKGENGEGLLRNIAEIIEFPHEPGVDKANAELIMLAPELLKALETTTKALKDALKEGFKDVNPLLVTMKLRHNEKLLKRLKG